MSRTTSFTHFGLFTESVLALQCSVCLRGGDFNAHGKRGSYSLSYGKSIGRQPVSERYSGVEGYLRLIYSTSVECRFRVYLCGAVLALFVEESDKVVLLVCPVLFIWLETDHWCLELDARGYQE